MCRAVRTSGGAGRAGGAQARPLHDDLVRAMGETVERAVGEDGIVEQGHPLIDGTIAGDDRRCVPASETLLYNLKVRWSIPGRFSKH